VLLFEIFPVNGFPSPNFGKPLLDLNHVFRRELLASSLADQKFQVTLGG
jgi:hypothetical protein